MPTTATDVQIPAGLPVLPGAALAARYVLSGVEPLNRGDTLDALSLPGRRVGLIVADVVGNGFGAAVRVAEMRAVLSERLTAGADLRSVMSSAERFAASRPELCATTACVVTLGLDDGDLEWATAGHPSPVWLSPDGVPQLLSHHASRPLGTGGRATTHRVCLAEGEMVGLFTDGLVNSLGRPMSSGRERFFRALGQARGDLAIANATPAEIADHVCDHVLRNATSEGRVDDAALLIAMRSGVPKPFRLCLPALPENLPSVRHRINEWLDGLGAGLMDHVGLGHAVVELAANAIEHAYVDAPSPEHEMRIHAELAGDGVVTVAVADRGRWRDHSSQGRGLMMAAGLSDTIKVNRSAEGTVVTLTQRLTRPVPLLQEVTSGAEQTLEEMDEFEAHVEPGLLVATGPIDDLSIDLFDAALTKVTRAGTADAVVDLEGISHLASPGVQALFDFTARSRRMGASLGIRAPTDSLARQILDLVDLPTVR